jgi:hypothetical protein
VKVILFSVHSIFSSLTSGNEMVTYKESFLCAHLTGAVSVLLADMMWLFLFEQKSFQNHTKCRPDESCCGDGSLAPHIKYGGMKVGKWHQRKLSSLSHFGLTAENSLITKLIPYQGITSINSYLPQQLHHCHYVFIKPEKVIKNPTVIYSSLDCMKLIGLDINERTTDLYCSAFVGNILLPGLDQPYATLYGCHSYGTWFGQLGCYSLRL